MIKFRINMFETNSSSTHTCIICNNNDYKKWVNGEYAYINCPLYVSEIAKESHCENAIKGNFFEVEAMKKIPLTAIFSHTYQRTSDEIKKKCEEFSFYDVYFLLLEAANSNWKDDWISYCDDEIYIDEDDERMMRLLECLKGIQYNKNTISNQDLFEIVYNTGFSSFDKISDCYEGTQYVDSEIIDGTEIVVVSEYSVE